jgi:hypothetical protein
MEGQPPYFVVPFKVQERINEFCVASNCTLRDVAERQTQKLLTAPEYCAAIVARAWTTNIVWPVDEQECVAFAVVRAIAFARAADDYRRTCDDEHMIFLKELLDEALVTEAFRLLQSEPIQRAHSTASNTN